MADTKFRGTRVVLDDWREVVVPRMPLGMQRALMAKIRAASAAQDKLKSAPESEGHAAMVEATERMAAVVAEVLPLNHPEITLENLMATCADDTISEMYLALWKRGEGRPAGEAASP
jgi:hypothetical protein